MSDITETLSYAHARKEVRAKLQHACTSLRKSFVDDFDDDFFREAIRGELELLLLLGPEFNQVDQLLLEESERGVDHLTLNAALRDAGIIAPTTGRNATDKRLHDARDARELILEHLRHQVSEMTSDEKANARLTLTFLAAPCRSLVDDCMEVIGDG